MNHSLGYLDTVMTNTNITRLVLLIVSIFVSLSVNAEDNCKEVTIVQPTPYNANGGELILLSDGTMWKDQSYLYLYLYLYNPRVLICPSSGKLILDSRTIRVSRVK